MWLILYNNSAFTVVYYLSILRGSLARFVFNLVHHHFMSVKVSMLNVHLDLENCSELPSVVAFCTIASDKLAGKCVLLIATVVQLSSVKTVTREQVLQNLHFSARRFCWCKVLISSPLQRVGVLYIRMCMFVENFVFACVLYIVVFSQIILKDIDSDHSLNFFNDMNLFQVCLAFCLFSLSPCYSE